MWRFAPDGRRPPPGSPAPLARRQGIRQRGTTTNSPQFPVVSLLGLQPGRICCRSVTTAMRCSGDRRDDYERLERATEGIEAPFALVDLDAMWANADDMLRRAAGKPIRVASKSVRCRPVLERILARGPGYRGLLTYTLPESLWLAARGSTTS